MEPTREHVLGVVGRSPSSIGDLGLALASAEGVDTGPHGAPVGQRLAVAGLSLSGLQRRVDELVGDGLVVEVLGKDLWDRGLPTGGTRAMGRYYLAAEGSVPS